MYFVANLKQSAWILELEASLLVSLVYEQLLNRTARKSHLTCRIYRRSKNLRQN